MSLLLQLLYLRDNRSGSGSDDAPLTWTSEGMIDGHHRSQTVPSYTLFHSHALR
jgi:hypothetical protein